MQRLVFILISFLSINSSCSERICEKASTRATNDFKAGQYFLHSEEVLPVDNAYFYVLREYYNINWRFTDSLDYYHCYDSTMLIFLGKKYQINVLARASEMADSLERTPNWRRTAEYSGGIEGLMKLVVEKIETKGIKLSEINHTKVFVTFVIDTSGKVRDTKIIKGEISHLIEKQILDIISSTQWTPEYQYGKPVDSRMTMPIQLEFRE